MSADMSKVSRVPPRCFHVDAGKPCTRYLEGSKGERRATIERIENGIAAARGFRASCESPINRAYYEGMIDAFETLRDGMKGARLHEPDSDPAQAGGDGS